MTWRMVNNDPDGGRLGGAVPPYCGVSLAERIIPAADLSSRSPPPRHRHRQHEKALNGALTIGTLDGANIEIREAVGAENFFAFGLTTEEVSRLKTDGYDPMDYVNQDAELQEVMGMLASGFFSPEQRDLFHPVLNSLTKRSEQYCLLADFRSYLDAQSEVDALFPNGEEWTRRAILNVARMGGFSSDRAVLDYSREIGHEGRSIRPAGRRGTSPDSAQRSSGPIAVALSNVGQGLRCSDSVMRASCQMAASPS
jgi:starch phosphorylase